MMIKEVLDWADVVGNGRRGTILRALADVVEAAKEVAATAPTDVNDLVAALDRLEAL